MNLGIIFCLFLVGVVIYKVIDLIENYVLYFVLGVILRVWYNREWNRKVFVFKEFVI